MASSSVSLSLFPLIRSTFNSASSTVVTLAFDVRNPAQNDLLVISVFGNSGCTALATVSAGGVWSVVATQLQNG